MLAGKISYEFVQCNAKLPTVISHRTFVSKRMKPFVFLKSQILLSRKKKRLRIVSFKIVDNPEFLTSFLTQFKDSFEQTNLFSTSYGKFK